MSFTCSLTTIRRNTSGTQGRRECSPKVPQHDDDRNLLLWDHGDNFAVLVSDKLQQPVDGTPYRSQPLLVLVFGIQHRIRDQQPAWNGLAQISSVCTNDNCSATHLVTVSSAHGEGNPTVKYL